MRRHHRTSLLRRGRRTSTRRRQTSSLQRTLVTTKNPGTSSTARFSSRSLNRISTGRFRDLPTLWPDRFMCKLKYVDSTLTTIQIAANIGGPIMLNYRVNSLYDPNVAISAEGVIAGYTELSQMYSYYRVHAAKLNCTMESGSGTQTTLVVSGFDVSNNPPASYTAMQRSIGNPYVVWGLMGLGLGNSGTTLENYCKLDKLLGSRMVTTEKDLAASVTTNPVTQLFCFIAISPPSAPAQTYQITPIVEIEFWAEFYGRDFEYA